MDSSLWVAKTGLDAQQRRMTVVANNLANVNTTGFKRDRAVFEDLLYQTIRQPGAQVGQDANSPTGLVLGTGTRVVATEKIHSQGNMIQTDNALDLAIDGDGFLQTLRQDGNIGYTRDGSLKLNNVGQLVTYCSLQSLSQPMPAALPSVKMAR
jgi:flagellar basal-body rod protein FlgG